MALRTRLRRSLFRLPVYLYRWRLGWLLGHRFLLLLHIGRRTGRRHETVLEIMEYRPLGPEAVVMSGWGHRAQWLRNIEARPGAEVIIGRTRFVAAHRLLAPEEAVRVVAGYEQRNHFMAPLVRAVLSRLLGWPYRSSDSHRSRLVAQLPFVAFSPRS